MTENYDEDIPFLFYAKSMAKHRRGKRIERLDTGYQVSLSPHATLDVDMHVWFSC